MKRFNTSAISQKVGDTIEFSKSVWKEVSHLKFPTRAETTSYLIIVLIIAMFCAGLFFAIDALSYKIVHRIIGLFI